jgi:hypothetical protein
MLTRSALALRSLKPPHPASPSRVLSTTSLIRPFSTAHPLSDRPRAPALADIQPDDGPKFDARQREFREQLATNQRRREQEESASRLAASRAKSASSVTSASASPATSDESHTVVDGIDQTLSSLSFTHAEEARAREQDGGKKTGPLSSLFYGTEAGRNMDKDIERSFSQVLARGKYVHTIVLHEVYPDKVDEYAELVGMWYPKMAGIPDNKVNLVGSWRTEVGDCDTFGDCSTPSESLN